MTDTKAELEAIKIIHDVLVNMDDSARERVLQYVLSALEITMPIAGMSRLLHRQDALDTDQDGMTQECEQARDVLFADLYNSAGPKSNPEKALVAGYWLQVRCGAVSFDAGSANRELTNLGYKLSNITDALTKLIRRSPSLVVQVRKQGTSRQARKLYKITHEGVRRVEELVASTSQQQGRD